MQIAGWRRVPKLRARDYTLRDEIPGRKKKERKKGKEGEREGEKERTGDLVDQGGTADINNATCVSGSLELGCFRAAPATAFLFLPECILLCSPRARRRKAVPRDYAGEGGK